MEVELANITDCFLPQLVENVFENYQEKYKNCSLTKEDREKLFCELSRLLGEELVERSLHLLDEYRFTYYYSKRNRQQCLVELHKGTLYFRVIPGINYCKCDFFQSYVLQLPSGVLYHDLPSGTTTTLVGWSDASRDSYTCPHVLALKLHQLLKISAEPPYSKTRMDNTSPCGDYKFVGRLDHVKTFNAAIKSICFNDYGIFQISDEGLRITVDQARSIQATLFMPPGAFTEFHVQDFQSFGLKMNILSECLNLFGTADCSVQMMYKGQGDPLKIILYPYDDEDVSTEWAIKTLDCEEPIDYDMNLKGPDLNVIFVRGPNLAKIFHELEKSAEEFEFITSPDRPHFKITTIGIMQAVLSVEVAKTSPMMMMFNCPQTVVARYKGQQIRLIDKAMQAATKVAIKTNSVGLLELHIVMQGEGQEQIFVQFCVIPLLNSDE